MLSISNTICCVFLLLVVSSAQGDDFGSCDESCHDVHRYCGNAQYEDEVDCNDEEWQIRCNMTCGLCTPCDLSAIHDDTIERIEDLGDDIDSVEGSLASELNSLKALVNQLTNKVNNLESNPVKPLTLTGRLSSPGGSGSPLMTGSGSQTWSNTVNFDKTFKSNPEVSVSMYHVDTYNDANTRISVWASDVSKTSMKINVTTWGDSRCYRIGVAWVAAGLEA